MRRRTTFGLTLIKALLWGGCAIVYFISFNALKGTDDTIGMLFNLIVIALALPMCLLNAIKIPRLWELRKQDKASKAAWRKGQS